MHSRKVCIAAGVHDRTVCMAGVMLWEGRGVHGREGYVCMAGGMHAEQMATEAGGMHPTGMHSCCFKF